MFGEWPATHLQTDCHLRRPHDVKLPGEREMDFIGTLAAGSGIVRIAEQDAAAGLRHRFTEGPADGKGRQAYRRRLTLAWDCKAEAMTAAPARLSVRRLPPLPMGLGFVLVIGGTIAAMAPFDVVFSAATGQSAPARVVLFCFLALLGSLAGHRIGLRIRPEHSGRSVGLGLAFALIVAVWVAGTDFLFRSILPVAYVDFIHQPLGLRLAYFMLRAFNENVFYRLFLFSVLAWGMTRIWPDRPAGRPASAAMWSAMVVAQMANIGLNVCLFDPPGSVAGIVYDGLRYIVPGVCWAWLYRRSGFATAEVASVSCHIFLQPLLVSTSR
jgi:hypothetical protein